MQNRISYLPVFSLQYNFRTCIILLEEYKQWSSSLCSVHYVPATFIPVRSKRSP